MDLSLLSVHVCLPNYAPITPIAIYLRIKVSVLAAAPWAGAEGGRIPAELLLPASGRPAEAGVYIQEITVEVIIGSYTIAITSATTVLFADDTTIYAIGKMCCLLQSPSPRPRQ